MTYVSCHCVCVECLPERLQRQHGWSTASDTRELCEQFTEGPRQCHGWAQFAATGCFLIPTRWYHTYTQTLVYFTYLSVWCLCYCGEWLYIFIMRLRFGRPKETRKTAIANRSRISCIQNTNSHIYQRFHIITFIQTPPQNILLPIVIRLTPFPT